MLKKGLSVAFVLMALLLLVVACNNQEPKDGNTDSAPTSEKDGQDMKEKPEEEITLPKTTLHKTDQGESVQSLQEILNKVGYSLTVNGEFNAMTTWAVTDFQMQQEGMAVSGIYNEATKEALSNALENESSIEPAAGLEKPDNDKSTISNPHEILTLVNKEHALPANFVPRNLVKPDVRFPFTESLPKMQMREVAAGALEEMFQAGDNAGIDLFAQSGYRSYDRQDAIFASNVAQHGEEAANTFSARPGESEHQSGLTMDVTSPDIGYKLTVEFGETDEGQWVQQHAAEYGFIIRYPKGKEEITKYQYEPWHLRYVGQDAAEEIMQKGLTLEEYLGVK
ncbi:D-alanyl-D-alanine carboxypeptidase family protein [Virgibacillus litoralis]|uniref:D-alanyl-D-alanine carboxypeptidase n=1 Tax=Virgibacillus litoralis TaxID=578221 RepID=A0ABS4HCA1_9BACI|nr:D-alanyl-D-alanine carboxypeptidase family protein [Virgibacillus litoralis]MBP1948540.1 D-alanyl-D-alanine carboxypeptidase [Virgibacillus litoralis]